jgi:hypothetical protein
MESYLHKLVSYYWNGDKEYGFVTKVQKTSNGNYRFNILSQQARVIRFLYTEYSKLNLEE